MRAARIGILSALTASACCLGPAALAAVGLGGLGLGVFFARFSWALVGAAAVLLLAGWKLYFSERRKCARGQCQMPGRRVTLAALGIASVVVAGFAALHLWPLVTKTACAISCPRVP